MIDLNFILKYIKPELQVKLRNYLGRSKEEELKFLKYFIKSGDTVLDIGAHRGTYTYKLIKIIGSGGYLYVFEPQIELVNYLKEAFRKYTNINYFNSIVGKDDVPSLLHIPIHNNQLSTGGASTKVQSSLNQTRKIQSLTIDSLNLAKCDFIKIDVEGSELSVIEGAKRTLLRFKPIILIEIDYHLCGSDMIKLIKLFISMKYQPSVLIDKKLVPLSFSQFNSPDINRIGGKHTLNFFLIAS